MQLQFTVVDVQRTKVGEKQYAAATLAPILPPDSGIIAMPAAISTGPVHSPASIRLSGLDAADVVDWQLDDVITLTLSRSPATT